MIISDICIDAIRIGLSVCRHRRQDNRLVERLTVVDVVMILKRRFSCSVEKHRRRRCSVPEVNVSTEGTANRSREFDVESLHRGIVRMRSDVVGFGTVHIGIRES